MGLIECVWRPDSSRTHCRAQRFQDPRIKGDKKKVNGEGRAQSGTVWTGVASTRSWPSGKHAGTYFLRKDITVCFPGRFLSIYLSNYR